MEVRIGVQNVARELSLESDQSVDEGIGDPAVGALRVGTGKALGVHASGALLAGFSPRSRGVQEQELALHSTREWRPDDRRSNRPGSGA